MAIVDGNKGKITLSFYKQHEGGDLIQLKSKHLDYDTTAAAWNAAISALDQFPQIAFVSIDFEPASGSVRVLEKVYRGPVF